MQRSPTHGLLLTPIHQQIFVTVPNYVNTSTAVTSSRPTEIIPQYNQISAASPSSPSPSQVQSASVHNQQQTNLVYLQNGNIPISNDFTTNTLPPITTIPPPPPPPNNNNNNSNALANTFTGPNLPLSRRHINPSPQVFNPETRTYESFNPETGTYESFNHIPTLVFDSQHSRHERPQSIPLQQPLPNSFHNSVSTYYQQPYLPVSQQLSTLQQQQQLQLQRLQPPTHSTSASAPVNNSNDTNLLSKTTTLQVNNVSAAATKSTTDVRINNEPLSENNARKSPKGTLTLSKSIDCEAVPNKSDRPATQDDDVATPTIKGSGDSNAIDNTKSPKKLLITTNEMSIIDDLRKYLQPSGFQYFLKLMDMVNNDIIDRDALVDFITPAFNDDSDKEHGLLQRLKTLVGYGGGSAKYQLKTIASTIPKPDLSELLSIEESPSYRKVTNLEWVNQPCSARDDLCREVLNDVYISYPTEESEGSNADTFTLNRYEEQLHRCEEKRYEFDSVIDDNEKAIILLQMILEDLEKLEAKDDSDSDSDSDSDEDSEDNDNDDDGDDEERDNEEKFDSLVNQLNKFIIIKAIKVAYGKRHAPRVIEGLLKHPIQNIPAILEFLESEGEKWELARTELNDIWREIEKENHVLSLKRKRNEISGRK
ncbi:Sin3 family co-repressor-domain-containing protein [Zychaea mexicana]|uniref:Sin3 family co-repressor-domain-containing protein n=1 Tax=Zychaea mexicana TaxID=64656 RepID=UPI0022FEC976|nr:Sin3 family co-repressor-domain-containing protein [Zychaea mexicana]KAI9489008.1 Sin3 family co-repressor-domain-containing protein [Zychaea mexicana]